MLRQPGCMLQCLQLRDGGLTAIPKGKLDVMRGRLGVDSRFTDFSAQLERFEHGNLKQGLPSGTPLVHW